MIKNKSNMDKTRKNLLTIFIIAILLPLLFVGFFELWGIGQGILLDAYGQLEFVVMSVMELVTIICIPVSLRLFKFTKVRKELAFSGKRALVKWGKIRLVILGSLFAMNILLYYLFMQSSFGYLAIIVFISMFFVYPGKTKCEEELYNARG